MTVASDLAIALALLAAGAAGGAWGARRRGASGPRGSRGGSGNEASQLEASGSDPFGHAGVTGSDRMRVAHRRRDERIPVRQLDLASARLDHALTDIGAALGAVEVIFWEWNEASDRLRPRRWTAGSAQRPGHFRMEAWGPLVQWAAEERITHCQGEGERPTLAAGPVLHGEQLLGVISASAEGGLGLDRRAVQEWMPRHAARLAEVLEHVWMANELRWREAQHETLVAAAGRLRQESSPEALLHGLCDTALELTSGSFAALVHWREHERAGTVQFATPGLGIAPPLAVVERSLVGFACLNGTRVVFEDASAPAPQQLLCGPGERFARTGSLAIKPLRSGRAVIGALVVAAEHPGVLSEPSTRGLDLLEAAAVSALSLVWQFEQASQRAETDALTGLHNRLHFDRRFREELKSTDRYGGQLSLVLVDVDHFKLVNDEHGHEAGDDVLRHVAKVLADGVREVDLCARVGGEEIALLLPRTELRGAVELAERLRRSLEERPARHGGREIRVTASFGVSTYPETAERHEALYPSADRALYAAKHAGRNQVRAAQASDVRGRS